MAPLGALWGQCANRPVRRLIVVGLTAGLLGCTPAGVPSAPITASVSQSPVARTIDGSVTISGYQSNGLENLGNGQCLGAQGYGDINPGAQVRIRDQSDEVIGVSELKGPTGSIDDTNTHCTFEFTAAGLPDATFYSIEIGNRGSASFSAAELEANDWSVALQLGE
jgi:hypothetical protein